MGFSNFANMFNLTCLASINSTDTEDVWRTRAASGNYFVQLASVSTGLAEQVNTPRVAFGGTNTGKFFGRLISASGSGSKFRVTVQVIGSATVTGNSSTATALTNAQYNTKVRANSTSKLLELTAPTTGNVIVIGGNANRMQVIWNGLTNDI